MYFAERYYEINIESIDQEIIDKAQEIIKKIQISQITIR